MKANVDLTNDRVFGKQMRFVKIYPYKNTTIHEKELNDNWGIFQGNSNERSSKKVLQNEEKICDRCGKIILPYINNTLCNVCENDLEEDETFLLKGVI